MLESLTISNFKGFSELDLELRPLTLLTGLNGVGKSSVLQALLLLRQSYLQKTLVSDADMSTGLVLNGDLVQIGTGADAFFEHANGEEIRFTLAFDAVGNTTWRYTYDRRSDVLSPAPFQQATSISVYETSLFTDEFQYLQAERMGPRTSFDKSDHMVRVRRQIGSQGQYAAHFLDLFRETNVDPAMHHPDAASGKLLAQVTAWMSEISPGTRIDLAAFNDMDLMQLQFGFPGSKFFRPTNVGFGITYTLPVLTAILSSSPGALILLENPEAHLHPRGQSRIGDLVARAAGAGIQVLMETHSDHILNGIRIAVRRSVITPERRIIEPDQIALHFFQRAEGTSASQGVEVLTPELDDEGRLDFWPENFFDEWSKSLDKLLYGD